MDPKERWFRHQVWPTIQLQVSRLLPNATGPLNLSQSQQVLGTTIERLPADRLRLMPDTSNSTKFGSLGHVVSSQREQCHRMRLLQELWTALSLTSHLDFPQHFPIADWLATLTWTQQQNDACIGGVKGRYPFLVWQYSQCRTSRITKSPE